MERNDVASLEELFLILSSVNTSSLDYVSRTECVVCSNLHTEALSNTSYVTTYVTECEDTNLLTKKLRTSLTIVEVTYGEHEQTENELSNSVSVLTRSILYNYVVSCSSSEVNIIVTSTCTNNDLQILSCIENLSSNLI